MKNLQSHRSAPVDLGYPILGFCLDYDNATLFTISQSFEFASLSLNSEQIDQQDIEHGLDPKLIDLKDFEDCEMGSRNPILHLEFIVEKGSIIVALRNGMLLRIGVSSFSPPSECLYKHNTRIESIDISNEQDLIVIADDRNQVLILSIDGIVISETDAITNEKSAHQPVGVGWGSKETQFFGLDGRPSKESEKKNEVQLTNEELTTIHRVEKHHYFKDFINQRASCTKVIWRSDSNLLATLTHLPETDKHQLKVWNRNLELQYMSEKLIDIQNGLLSWTSDKNFICCAQQRSKKINEIVMFEKNGMVHQRISLPTCFLNLHIVDMCWSHNSEILAILAQQFFFEGDELNLKPILMFYTMQNCHYYLKHSTYLNPHFYYQIKWNSVDFNRLHVMTSGGRYQEYSLSYDVTIDQETTVTVVDSNRILLTPLRVCNVPPPMAAKVASVDSLIHSIMMNPRGSTDIFIITIDNKIIRTARMGANPNRYLNVEQNIGITNNIKLNGFEERLMNHELYEFEKLTSYQHFRFYEGDLVVAAKSLENITHDITVTSMTKRSELIVLELKNELGQLVPIKTKLILEKEVVNICQDLGEHKSKSGIYVCFSDGTIANFTVPQLEKRVDSEISLNFTTDSPWPFDRVKIQVRDNSIVSLTPDSTLRCGINLITPGNCTSFTLTEHYLIYTTTDNLLHFLKRENLDKSTIETWSQSIEPGAYIIAVDHETAKVVLQMPRGNLDIIHPRLLVLYKVHEMLKNSKISHISFDEIFRFVRHHRINTNFIADWIINEESFNPYRTKEYWGLGDCPHSHLITFLTEIDEENTITGRYRDAVSHFPVHFSYQPPRMDGSKVSYICSKLFFGNDRGKVVYPELVRCIRLDCYDSALYHIAGSTEKKLENDAISFMLYYTDFDKLFSEAIKTYNIDIALMVAQASKRDPKSYLPVLDRFKSIESDSLMFAEMDLYVKDYEKAILNLCDYYNRKGGDDIFERIIELAESKRLYKKIFACRGTKTPKFLRRVIPLYSNYLIEKRHYEEAGVAYSILTQNFSSTEPDSETYLVKALNCFCLAGSYQMAFPLFWKPCASVETRKVLQNTLTKHLQEKKDLSALLICQLESEFSNQAVKLAIEAGHYYQADLISHGAENTRIKISVGYSIMVGELTERCYSRKSEVSRQIERLKYILDEYYTKLNEKSSDDNPFISDTLSTRASDTLSSVSEEGKNPKAVRSGEPSIATRQSSRGIKSQSSKSRKIKLTEGSRYEHIAIAQELHRFVSDQKQIMEDAFSCLAGLFEYRFHHDLTQINASCLNEAVKLNHNLCAQIIETFWPNNVNDDQRYSLFRRLKAAYTSSDQPVDSIDLQVLISPVLPELKCFDFM